MQNTDPSAGSEREIYRPFEVILQRSSLKKKQAIVLNNLISRRFERPFLCYQTTDFFSEWILVVPVRIVNEPPKFPSNLGPLLRRYVICPRFLEWDIKKFDDVGAQI